MKKFLIWGSLFLTSCSGFNPGVSGALVIAVQFPSSFSAQLLKPDTVAIRAVVYGSQIPFAQAKVSPRITPQAPRVLVRVPVGEKTVLVAAYDSKGRILTAAKARTVVTSTTRLELEAVAEYRSLFESAELALLEQLEAPVPPAPGTQSSKPDGSAPGAGFPTIELGREGAVEAAETLVLGSNSSAASNAVAGGSQAGGSASAPVGSIFVNLVKPAGNLILGAGQALPLEAGLRTPPGAPVAGVEFFADGQSLGVVNQAPFRLVWDTQGQSGSRLIKARARGANGQALAESTSLTVTFTSQPPGALPASSTSSQEVAAEVVFQQGSGNPVKNNAGAKGENDE